MPKPRSACLIFNPVSGQSDADEDLANIRSLLEEEFDLDIQLTTKEVGAGQLAREAVDRGASMLVVSGGDGTLSAAAAALVETEIPLGIISRGTANAFASALGIPVNLEAACRVILEGELRRIDTARCNGKQMVLLAGIGFEAQTVASTNREAKERWGSLAYVFSGIQQLQQLEGFEASIETEDGVMEVTAVAVTVANVAPPTSVLAHGPAGIVGDDGLLDVTVVAPENRRGAIAASYHLLQSALFGHAVEREDIAYLRAKRVRVTARPAQKVALDGEVMGTTPIEIECIPGGLTVLVPTQSDDLDAFPE
jgi:YegS/Rv2252/BmrU family lipid kinase